MSVTRLLEKKIHETFFSSIYTVGQRSIQISWMKPRAFMISKIFVKRIEMSDIFTAPETNSHQVRNWSIMANFQTFDCFL